jgi:hypothetical protein
LDRPEIRPVHSTSWRELFSGKNDTRSQARVFPTMTRLSIAAATLLAYGCSMGPTALQSTHLAYNQAVDTVFAEELLLNIVRLRYLDMTEFLEISSITAQFELSASVGGDLGVSEGAPTALSRSGASYSDRPTIAFVPRDYEEFTRTYLSPISLESTALLLARGWQVSRVMRLTLRNVNGVWNDSRKPSAEFLALSRKFAEMHERGDLHFGFVRITKDLSSAVALQPLRATDLVELAESGYELRKSEDETRFILVGVEGVPVLSITEGADASEIRRMLHLKDDRLVYPIVAAEIARKLDAEENIDVQIRSIAQVMAHLSQGVEVPESHRADGIVPELENQGASESTNPAHGLFRVRVSKDAPAGASLAVQHRGHSFYVPDSDPDSRFTFLVLSHLFRLEIAGGKSRPRPVLTLPLN